MACLLPMSMNKSSMSLGRLHRPVLVQRSQAMAPYSAGKGTSRKSNDEMVDVAGLEQMKGGCPFDVLIAGGGPSGLALAACASGSGLHVGLIDPSLNSEWPNNYGVWVDEFEALGLEDCLTQVWPKARVIFEGNERHRMLNRPYGQVDRKKLKQRLVETCAENGVLFGRGQVLDVEHGEATSTAVCTNGARIDALLVADATGFSRRLLKFESSDGSLDSANVAPGYQVTYGILAEVESHPYNCTEEMVLMDWGSSHLKGDLYQRNEAEPSFLYVMPFTETLIFLEETSLVDRPAVHSEDLKERLQHRMSALGIKVKRIIEEERAMIPMGGTLPLIPQSVLGIGGSSGVVHPSTGYMVARALEKAPSVAEAIKMHVKNRAGNPVDHIALKNCWAAAWPDDERRQWGFMNLGMQILCELKPEDLRNFFRAFFALEDWQWGGYLSWRLSGVQCVIMGLALLSVAPASFRFQLVWEALPFLPEFVASWTVALISSSRSSIGSPQIELLPEEKLS